MFRLKRREEPGHRQPLRFGGANALFALAVCSLGLLAVAGRALAADEVVGGEIRLSAVALEIGGVALAAAIALAVRSIHRLFPLPVFLAYGFLLAVNIEMVSALDAVANLRLLQFATDGVFLRASALRPVFPLYTALLFVACVLCAWTGARLKRPSARGFARIAVSLGTLAVVLLSPAAKGETWQQDGLAARSLRSSLGSAVSVGSDPDAPVGSVTLAATVPPGTADADNGPPPPLLMPRGEVGRNVLLLILEGIPGIYLEQVRKETGVPYPVTMPALGKAADVGLIAPHTVAHNRQTIRGLYSILTGDHPRLDLSTPKIYSFIEADAKRRPPALPAVLGDFAYRTVYLQAADLAYMSKDLFMAEAGFDEVHGKEFFDYQYVPFEWGPDDKAFLEQAADHIDDLAGGERPWFLTLLTVGTHHPYGVPDDYVERFPNRKTASIAYLDEALGEFFERLKQTGVLDDTAVFIVCDESHGVTGHPFGRYWGLAAVLTPEMRGPVANDGVFGLIDIPRSVLDYLGADEAAARFPGRSLLREYQDPRTLHFGPFVVRRAGGEADSGTEREPCAVHRPLGGGRVRVYRPVPGGLFAPAYERKIVSGTEGKELRRKLSGLANRTGLIPGVEVDFDVAPGDRPVERRYPLIRDAEYALSPGGRRVLTTGQYLRIPASSRVRVELEAELRQAPLPEGSDSAGSSGESALRFALQILERYEKLDLPLPDLPRLSPGESLSLRFSFSAEEALSRVWAYLRADSLCRTRELKLYVRDFSLAVDEAPEADPDADSGGFHLERLKRSSGPLPPVAHAGGAYRGRSYTNCLEALEANAESFDLFELDFEWTRDGRLVGLHDWDVVFERFYGFQPRGPLSMSDLIELDSVPEMTVLDLGGLRSFLAGHPHARIVTDIKRDNLSGLRRMAECVADHETRVIPQIYHPDEFEQVVQLGYERIIWTLYRYPRNRDIGDIVRRAAAWRERYGERLFAVTMPVLIAKEGAAEALGSIGIPVYAHTVNSCEEYLGLRNLGVSSVYTDSLDIGSCAE